MGSLAQLAKSMGHTVTGSDQNVYPPMSTQLENAGITLHKGFDAEQLSCKPDLVIVGNVISRGNPVMEAVLNQHIPYQSGPQWLSEHLLSNKWVLAVAGTHGKTTTSSMLAWILEYAGFRPGFLIGGVPGNFPMSARLGESDFFVIEADEYDTAFFDKRSKFVHYHPDTLIINNLEFDHADIFDDLAAIQKQFHHLIRTVPSQGLIISPHNHVNIGAVLEQGCWSEQQFIGSHWQAKSTDPAGKAFSVNFNNTEQAISVGQIRWTMTGNHNVTNALNAIAAARHIGIEPGTACEALSQFKGVKRRMEKLGQVREIHIYDDFAHHPTAIEATLAGLRAEVKDKKVVAVIEPRSNTMKLGIHKDLLADATKHADEVIWLESESLNWSLNDYIYSSETRIFKSVDDILSYLVKSLKLEEPTHIVLMSNGSFGGIHSKLLAQLK